MRRKWPCSLGPPPWRDETADARRAASKPLSDAGVAVAGRHAARHPALPLSALARRIGAPSAQRYGGEERERFDTRIDVVQPAVRHVPERGAHAPAVVEAIEEIEPRLELECAAQIVFVALRVRAGREV